VQSIEGREGIEGLSVNTYNAIADQNDDAFF
jgi:hypothetical protein